MRIFFYKHFDKAFIACQYLYDNNDKSQIKRICTRSDLTSKTALKFMIILTREKLSSDREQR